MAAKEHHAPDLTLNALASQDTMRQPNPLFVTVERDDRQIRETMGPPSSTEQFVDIGLTDSLIFQLRSIEQVGLVVLRHFRW